MGISVPIGAEQYKNLKEISERLGFGLKKSVEYLVSYYWEREMKTVSEKIHSQPTKEIGKEEQYKELVASAFSSITNTKPTHSVPPAVVSSSVSKNQTTVSPKYTNPVSKTFSSNCSSCGAPKRTNAKFCYNCGNSV